ncbi:MAG TPA: FHA domain-containing protein [Polyangiaceae bacterium]|nr:FHA domain-containing protein [Polyangiaceae bacterium]
MLTFEPTELARTASRLTELVFGHEYGKCPWLAVRVDADDELAAVLRASEASTSASVPPGQIAFHTEVVSEAALRSARDGGAPPSVDWTALVRKLGDGRFHALSIRKRHGVDSAFEDRISLGRAMNKDIVLRHSSISKFHAYFQFDGDRCLLADAGSKNGTTVNGAKLPPKETTEVVNGDQILFGSVATTVLDARTLWRLMRLR